MERSAFGVVHKRQMTQKERQRLSRRLCCNPEHLEPVTRLENSHRGSKYRPSHCANGHLFTEENTVIRKTGHIYCRICDNKRQRERRQRGKNSS